MKTNNKTDNIVHRLRKAGFKIVINHHRPYEIHERYLLSKFEAARIREAGKGIILNQKGGKTVVKLITPDGREYKLEEVCSRKDNFCYKRGYSIPLMRILKQMKKEGVLDESKI